MTDTELQTKLDSLNFILSCDSTGRVAQLCLGISQIEGELARREYVRQTIPPLRPVQPGIVR